MGKANNKLFKESHGLQNGFIPVQSLTPVNLPIYGLQDSIITQIKKLADYMPEYIDHVYFIPNKGYAPFCYYHDYVYIDLHALDVETNQMLQTKESIQLHIQEMNRLRKEKNYVDFFSFMQKKIQISAFIELSKEIPMKQKYDVFRELYQRSEYGFEKLEPSFLKDVFAYREYSEEHQEDMKKLQEKLGDEKTAIVYRGVTPESTPIEKAYSWTLSMETAEFFASRFGSQGKIFEASVSVDRIRDYLPERQEEEVLILPQDIMDVRLVKE